MAVGVAAAFAVALAVLGHGMSGSTPALGSLMAYNGSVGTCGTVGAYSSGACQPLSTAGSISGKVTDTSSAGIAGVCVYLFAGGGSQQLSTSAVTAADGSYGINGVAPGSINVEFVANCGSANFVPQWYLGSTTEASSTPVVVTTANTARGIDATMQPGARINGTVTDSSGNPASGTCASAFSAGTSTLVSSASTGPDGGYSIAGLGAGSYDVKFSGGIFGCVGGAGQWYKNVLTQSAATHVTVNAGGTAVGIDDVLFATGQISGTVRNVGGSPAAYVQVCATLSTGFGYWPCTSTAADGTYTISALPPQSYVVAFYSYSASGGSSQWYSNASSLAAATPVSVSTGATHTGIDDLVPAATATKISGTVTDSGGHPIAGVCVNAVGATGAGPVNDTSSDGTYTLDGVAPGSYDIRFVPASPYGCSFNSPTPNTSTYAAQWFPGVTTQAAATAVVVAASTPRTGVNAQMAAAAVVTGTVTDASAHLLSGVCVNAYLPGATVAAGTELTTASGGYSLGGLAAGAYSIEFDGSCAVSGTYATQWYPNVATRATGTTVTVMAGSTRTGINDSLAVLATGSITGAVSDSSAAPVTGACVVVHIHGSAASVASATTAADGSYSLAALPPGTYDVYFDATCDRTGLFVSQWAGGVATQAASTPVVVTSGVILIGENATLLSLATGVISGTATDGSGAAAPGVCAEVFAAGATGFVSSSTSDATGRYSVINLAPGSYDVKFGACGAVSPYVTQWYRNAATQGAATHVTVLASQFTSGIDAVLAPNTGSFSGTVINGASGPLSGIIVSAFVHGTTDQVAYARTGADGTYSFPAIPVGTYDVEFNSYGGVVTQWYSGAKTQSAATPVAVTLGHATSGIGATMLSSIGSISGTVTDTSSASLANICVTAQYGSGTVSYATTAADGTYAISGVQAGSYTVEFADCATPAGYVAQWYKGAASKSASTPVIVAGGATTTAINASMAAIVRGSIAGRVTDSSLAPVSGVCVDAFSASVYGGTYPVGQMPTAADGTYSITGLQPGVYTVSFGTACQNGASYAPQWYSGATSQAAATSITVTAGSVTPSINATMRPGGAISGTVTDSSSASVANICVGVYGASPSNSGTSFGSATTGVDGTYSVEGLATGTYTVELTSCGAGNFANQWYSGAAAQATATTVTVTAGSTTSAINATMQAGGTISGTVTDAASAPLSGVCVVANTGSGFGNGSSFDLTAVDGTYSMTGLAPGSYAVGFSTQCSSTGNYANQFYPGVATQAAGTPLVIGVGTAATGINARMQVPASLAGMVTDGSGHPVMACVNAYQAGQSAGQAQTQSDGTYVISGLTAGSYAVEVISNFICAGPGVWYGGATSEATATPVTLNGGQARTGIDVAVVPATISGTVTSANGLPLSGVTVSAQGAGSGNVTTGSDGKYTISGLAEGTYTVGFGFCPNDTCYLYEYYPGVANFQDAAPVTVTAGTATTGINAVLLVGGTIAGTVTTTGSAPLSGVCVSVFDAGQQSQGVSQQQVAGYTQSDGTYVTQGLVPGRYQILFDPACSYSSASGTSLAAEWSGGGTSQATATWITVVNGQTTTSVSAALGVKAGDGAITGKVTDALGTGSAGICVSAFAVGHGPPALPAAAAFTESNGTYTLTSNGTAALAAGTYQVEFDPSCAGINPNNASVQWYNGVSTEGSATSVIVASGTAVGGVNDTLSSGSAVPVIASVTPSSGPVAGGTQVTITGTNLATSTVTVGGAALTITSDSATSIKGTTHSGTAGSADVVVHNAGGTATDPGGFSYVGLPTITSVSPSSGTTAGGTSITITGTNLSSATAVTIGGSPLTITSDTTTSITGTTPASAAGSVAVAVTTTGGTATLASGFTYVTKPTITGVAPSTGPLVGNTVITITGSNLASATSVTVGGSSLTVTSDTATSITGTTPPGSVGVAAVVVTTGLGVATDATGFTYVAVPVVSLISPVSGPTSGSTVVTITGTGLSGLTKVMFGTVAATTYTSVSGTSATATAPSASAGAVDVTVTTVGGTSAVSTPGDRFTYAPVPVVGSITPTTGLAAGGTSVTVTGSNFSGATAVRFGTVAGTNVTVVSATSITVTSPAGTAGTVDITITTPGGTSATNSGDRFSYQAAPAFTASSPSLITTTGQAYGYTFAASGSPAPTFALALGAPAWLSINATSGAVSGTVPSGITTFTYSVTATNGVSPAATAGPSVVTVHTPPAFTVHSPPTTGTAGQAYGYTFTATGNPAPTYGLSAGAPGWLTINTTTGAVSGTIPVGTTGFTYSVTASNGVGTAVTTGPFAVNVPEAPVFTVQSPSLIATTGHAYNYTFMATGNPAPTYAVAAGAPAWMAINGTTGAVSGTIPVGTMSFTYSVTASNGVGTAAVVGPFTVAAYALPATPGSVRAVAGVNSAQISWSDGAGGGAPTSFTVRSVPATSAITTNGSATSASVSGLQAGIEYTFTVTASDPGGASAPSTASNAVVPTAVAPQGATSGTGSNPTTSTTVGATTVSASATGSGTVTVATYPSDPLAAFAAGSTFFDVSVAPGASFSSVSFTACGLTAGETLAWWNPAAQAWLPVTGATPADSSGCAGVTVTSTSSPSLAQLGGTVFAASNPAGKGYWLVASDGGIFGFGDAGFYGSTGATPLNRPIVGMASTRDHKGYWLVASDGGIFAFGDAGFYGSTGAITLNKPIVGMAATPTGLGYWLVASDGGIFAFGDAAFFGSTGAITLNKPIVSMAATPTGSGYWLVASDGGIFAFGDAGFHGSTGALTLNKPIVSMAATPTGSGYWLVASDGGIFGFGDASFFGSAGATPLNRPIVGMAATPTGSGYWLVASDGGIFGYGDATFYGSTGAISLNKPIVGVAVG